MFARPKSAHLVHRDVGGVGDGGGIGLELFDPAELIVRRLANAFIKAKPSELVPVAPIYSPFFVMAYYSL